MHKVISIVMVMSIMFISCSNLESDVKEYRSITNKIDSIMIEVRDGKLNEAIGIQKMVKLNEDLREFENEVVVQYDKEEILKKDIEIQRKKEAVASKIRLKKRRNDSIKQITMDKRDTIELQKKEAKKARELEVKQKQAVAKMIEEEAIAERNAYVEELKAKGIFIVSFNGKSYEINVKEWEEWKKKENYNFEEEKNKIKQTMMAMGMAKAQELVNAMHRTLARGISGEGVTMKTVQGIQIFDVMTTGEGKFY